MFLYPPRPEQAIAPGLIKLFEGRGYIGQVKKNGTCTVISIDKNGRVKFYTRRNEPHKAWTPLPQMIQYFSQFTDCVFVGELLHNKHASVKNKIVLFDILRNQGDDMVGINLSTRLAVLEAFPPLLGKISMVKNYYKDLTNIFNALKHPIDEGIVLKDPKAKLETCIKEGMNSDWQVKCRRETKTYGY